MYFVINLFQYIENILEIIQYFRNYTKNHDVMHMT